MSLPLRRPSREPDAARDRLHRPRRRTPPRAARRALAAGLAALTTLGAAVPASPGPRGIGDRLFPTLGNPGYDVLSYDIALDYPGRNDRPMTAVTEITARATASLDHLNLDFDRGTVQSVQVDGLPAEHARHGEDLVVTPVIPVVPDRELRIVIRHTSDPRGRNDGGWLRTVDGLAMANQADAAHRVFPCNDHPSDKALFTFRITTPRKLTAVASGLSRGHRDRGTRRVWTYRTAHPMATELAQVSIGKSSVLRHRGPHGLPLRDVVPAADRTLLAPWLAKTPDQMAWLERRLGRFPFETYGVLIADAKTGFELETQTLSLFEKGLFTSRRLPAWYVEAVMVHEMAHQWFGNSVSPHRWSDLWLSESHATWYEMLYTNEKGDSRGSMEARLRRAYEYSDRWRADGGPPARPKPSDPGKKISIFRPIVYDGSALILYALREKIGKDAFGRLERAWVARHRDGSAGTREFIALASETAGRDLSGFLHGWLYGTKTPPMPGHPDWKSQPPSAAPAPPPRAHPGKPA
ncbi:M1 family metallopeptidase [Streptomyces halobius]|uniref:Aminopeptidase N n=1 Tax=Streptomyces halobius TaxID=2879846 RepID=A0ABY4M4P9_9ACTN|nr:M1 family metallopeptidase [Streptomyces halobius]UQA92700.1 M1 family metallopeptidase [Streptomyces halobius]